jgi:hypothetical protein
MRTPQTLLRIGALVSAGALLLTNPAWSLAAQDNRPCSFADERIVSAALGTPVHGYANAGTPPGFDTCEFGDLTLFRLSGADVTGRPGLAGLAQNVVLGLPPEVSTQIGGLEAGRTLEVPGYQIATLSDLGDTALWVRSVSFGVDALAVQRGNEVFVVQVFDRPDAQATSTAVARAVVANAPVAEASGAPSGGRPEVAADCGIDAANAVGIVCSAPTSPGSTSSADATTCRSKRPSMATDSPMPPTVERFATARVKWRTAAPSWVSPSLTAAATSAPQARRESRAPGFPDVGAAQATSSSPSDP